jgi:serine/threonine-protein kinase
VIGTTVGSYRIVSKLSVGGMGTVYRAEHTLIGKLAAVKVLHPELCTNPDIVNRFLNEAKATTTIKHPGIVEVFDFGHMPSGHAYLTMEFLEGMSLARRCSTRGKMSEGEAAILLRSVCSALQAAHNKGIVHRDLKPDNIFLVTDPDSPTGERSKILDFGIAKLTDVGLAGATKTGAVMGTPTYMSPEQCRGTGVVDHRADLYSLGCILYELVAGRPPFTNLGAGELIGAHLYIDPVSPRGQVPDLTAETEALIMSLLSKDPAGRPQTARELAQRLSSIAQQQGWITQSSPTGITAQSLPNLVPPQSARTELDHGAVHAATLPSRPPGAATPLGFTPTPLLTPASAVAAVSSVNVSVSDLGDHSPAEKPTTLSGAASSIIDVPRRSKMGLGLAMVAAAILAGGTVAFFKLRGADEHPAGAPTQPVKAAAAPEASPAPPSPPPSAPAPNPAPPVAVAPEPKPVTPTPVAPAAIDPAKPAAPIASVKPSAPAPKPAKLPKAAVTPKPKPGPAKPEPAQPSLIETDL